MSNQEWVMMPVEPTPEHLNSIAMRYDHGFGLLPEDQKDNLRAFARQMHEECTGQGFYKLEAAPKPPAAALPPYEVCTNLKHVPVTYSGNTGPAPVAPDVAGLVEALRSILGWRELRSGNEFPVERVEQIARDALAAHHKQEPSQ